MEALLAHPDFVATNPNRVRSVLGAFAAGNPTGFHRKDGKGYALVGREIRQLDDTNPQIAARMTQSFGRWRRYDPERQELMQAELRAILTSRACPDVREIAQKSLGAKGSSDLRPSVRARRSARVKAPGGHGLLDAGEMDVGHIRMPAQADGP